MIYDPGQILTHRTDNFDERVIDVAAVTKLYLSAEEGGGQINNGQGQTDKTSGAVRLARSSYLVDKASLDQLHKHCAGEKKS
jgi:hypothetical protein